MNNQVMSTIAFIRQQAEIRPRLKELLPSVDEIFAKGQREDGDYDTESVLEKCEEFLGNHCRENGTVDPRPISNDDDGYSHEASFLYIYAACNFILRGKFFAAEELLLYGWDNFNAIQNESDRKLYKGQIANWLVIFYQQVIPDMGAATRWALLNHADDGLVGHNKYGQGTQNLRYRFGMSKEALKSFNEIVNGNTLPQRMEGWSSRNRFADDQLVTFAIKHPEYAHLFASPTATLEFPPCIPYLTKLWGEVTQKRSRKQTTAHGNALEYFAAYLQLLIPGLVPRRKVIREMGDMEHDLVVSNIRQSSNLEADLFGRDYLIECKNWKTAVGVPEVGYFLYRMKLTHTSFGIMFATSGITGSTKKKISNAQTLCLRAFHEDGALCIVIEATDIQRIIEKKTTYRSLLMEKANQLRFGTSH